MTKVIKTSKFRSNQTISQKIKMEAIIGSDGDNLKFRLNAKIIWSCRVSWQFTLSSFIMCGPQIHLREHVLFVLMGLLRLFPHSFCITYKTWVAAGLQLPQIWQYCLRSGLNIMPICQTCSHMSNYDQEITDWLGTPLKFICYNSSVSNKQPQNILQV